MILREDFPFTRDEVIAAFIVLGVSLADAREAADAIAHGIRDPEVREAIGAWVSPDFLAALFIVSDVRSEQARWSAEGRDAFHASWRDRPSGERLERILDEIERIGPEWSHLRDGLRRELGRLPEEEPEAG
jgi:hypothetical protein